MIISVDLGYGFVKAVGEGSEERIIFPQVMAPAAEDIIERDLRLGGKRPGYLVELRPQGSVNRSSAFVGDLAIRESRGARMSVGRNRFGEAERKMSIVHTMTAAYLAGAEGQITLAFGLPLAWYKQQKDNVKKALQDTAMYVRVDKGPEKFIHFNLVQVFPQGVGALFAAPGLPQKGLIGLVDIGYYTTDYLLVDIRAEGVDPLVNYMSSMEIGIHTAVKLFANKFTEETGKPLTTTEAMSLWDRKEINFERRQLVNLEKIKEAALREVGEQVVNEIGWTWSERLYDVEHVFLAGGGAYEFAPLFDQEFKNTKVIDDAQFANARGFLNMARRVEVVAKKKEKQA